MAGERQHFLPRFLLKGFASRSEGDNSFVWVFRKDSPPFEANITKVGVSNRFYNLRDNNELDKLITDTEYKFVNCVDGLRLLVSDSEVKNAEIPEFITHMLLRTKYFRDSINKSTRFAFEALLTAMKRPDIIEKVILKDIKSNPDEFLKKVLPDMKGHNLSTKQKGQLLMTILKMTPDILHQNFPQLLEFIDTVREYIRTNFQRLATEAHVKAMMKSINPQLRIDFARRLNWFIIVRQAGSFVLGDVGVVSIIGAEGRLKSLPDVSDDVQQMWLPIGDTHLLIGAKELPVYLNNEEINIGTASLSNDFMISSRNSEYEKLLAETLGTRPGLITDNELENLVKEVLESI